MKKSLMFFFEILKKSLNDNCCLKFLQYTKKKSKTFIRTFKSIYFGFSGLIVFLLYVIFPNARAQSVLNIFFLFVIDYTITPGCTKLEVINSEYNAPTHRTKKFKMFKHDAIEGVLNAVNMKEAQSLVKGCKITIDLKEYTEHIDEWKGLSPSYKAKKIPGSLEEYRKGAINWANGRRALTLATKVFPQFISQSTQVNIL
ncbi:hypothetical protein RFI_31420 [Reticulomyxa filosa]|uniref:Uncharacterized protein n=1 Tax=Reticulomyxa filosa TaxID=46433 RepID=X6LWI8_RETFI|nr:hypothetical protein RFI_31420 [Reticulomyxa filosa]|eukprot:ETO05974.1 hypothetical protein RFI_31420 [Reticulomyxa filosa]